MPLKLNKDWKFKEFFPTVSAYTTTFNCLKGKYPFVRAIESFLWADQVVVVDGGSTDGTREALQELEEKHDNLEVHDISIDEDDPGKDGQLKTMSRAMTSEEFVVQFDADEICLGSTELWKKQAKKLSSMDFDIVCMLVLEPLGFDTNVRMNKEHNPWKWRLYKNKPEIVHGIPKNDRLEKDDKVFSKGNSDGCFPIHVVTNELGSSYISPKLQKLCHLKNNLKKDEYTVELSKILVSNEPCVLHVGHVDLENKIRHYLNSWHNWWCELYDKDPSDPENNKYFPGVEISKVTNEMIKEKVSEIIKTTPSVNLKELKNVSMEKTES